MTFQHRVIRAGTRHGARAHLDTTFVDGDGGGRLLFNPWDTSGHSWLLLRCLAAAISQHQARQGLIAT